jgi:hypothetical protein
MIVWIEMLRMLPSKSASARGAARSKSRDHESIACTPLHAAVLWGSRNPPPAGSPGAVVSGVVGVLLGSRLALDSPR